MKTIVILTEHYFEYVMGGAEQQISLLIPELIKRGYTVHYIFINYDSKKSESSWPVTLHPIRPKRWTQKFGSNIFLYTSAVCKILNRVKPDVIYQHSTHSFCGIAAKYAQKNQCKLVWHIAAKGDVLPYKIKRYRSLIFDYLDKRCAGYGIRNADCIVGQAKYQDELLFENYKKHCSCIIGNWHPLVHGTMDKPFPIKILWVANIKPHKQPELFIDLAAHFKEKKNVRFLMVGRPASGTYQGDLELKINELNNLKYLGEIPNQEVNRLLLESHIFISTSKSEGFSNTFIQSWLCKVPVISLNSDPDDLLKRKKIGRHSKSFQQLIKDVHLLISDELLRSKMGDEAKQYAEKHHSLKNIDKLMDLF